jgi:hypothetical protein
MIREPFVAGQFYPGNPDVLRETVDKLLDKATGEKVRAVSIVSPHAGYIYSGTVAGLTFAQIEVPNRVILIGPNHTGLGERFSVMTQGTWRTPLGDLCIDTLLAEAILEGSELFKADSRAHTQEHCLEVQLPFIYRLNPSTKIVPITIMGAGFEDCKELATAIATAIKNCNEEVLIVASSDMNHFESEKTTQRKDKLAIKEILELDAKGLLEITDKESISMCGAVPAAITIMASKELGARTAKLAGHSTSFETSGDYNYVVGYAGIIIR